MASTSAAPDQLLTEREDWLLFREKKLRRMIKNISKKEVDMNVEGGQDAYNDLMRRTAKMVLELKKVQRKLAIGNVPGFTGGFILRDFHIKCSTGYPVMDRDISKFITDFVRKSHLQTRPSIDEISAELSIMGYEYEIELSEDLLDQMTRKVFVDMYKQYSRRSRRDEKLALAVYCEEEMSESDSEDADQLAAENFIAQLLISKKRIRTSAGNGVEIDESVEEAGEEEEEGASEEEEDAIDLCD